MPVITSIGGQVLDDVYILLTNPPQNIQGVNASAVGVVGTVSRGIPGAVYNFSSYPAAVQQIGASALNLTGPIAIQNLIRQKCGDIYFVPVFGQGASAASLTLEDATSNPVLILTFADPNPQTTALQASYGTYGNATTAVVTAGTAAGTFNLTVTAPDGRVDTFTGLTPAQAVTAINSTAKAAVASLPVVSNPTGNPTVTPASTGGSLNGGTIYGVWTWTNANGETVASQEFTTTIPAGTTGSFTFKPPTAPSNATGYNLYISTTTGTETLSTKSTSPTATTTVTTLPAAGAAVPPTTNTAAIVNTNVPAPGNFNFSGGSIGAATVDNDYIGTTLANGQKTALAALATVGSHLNFVMAAEQYSTAINTAVLQFGQQNNCTPAVCLSPGTNAATAIASVKSFVQKGAIVCFPWQTVYDPDIQQNRVTAPTSFVEGVGAVMGPEQSFGNKSVIGSLGTDVPLAPQDIQNLVAANIMVVGVPIPAGGVGIRNGQDSTGVQVFVTRMQYFIENLVNVALGPYVDQLQTTWTTDPTRRNAKGSVGQALAGIAGNQSSGQIGRIDSYSVVCDLTNNTSQTIADEELFMSVAVNLLSNAGKIYVTANIGQGVQVQSSSQAA